MKTNKQKVGSIGEDVACRFLVKQGFRILDRNYLKKWGELDIIAKKDGVLRFVEVKTVSRENIKNISRETLERDRPEENVHTWKIRRLHRTINSYLLEKHVIHETQNEENKAEWKLDVLVVFLDIKNKKAKIRFTEDIIM
jgi:putative endonuclease